MSASAQELTSTRCCKAYGCSNDVTKGYDRGIYAGLCDEHIEVRRRQASSDASARHQERTGGQSPVRSPDLAAAAAHLRAENVSHESSLKSLMTLAKKADRARGAAEKAMERARGARALATAATEEYQRALKAAMGEAA